MCALVIFSYHTITLLHYFLFTITVELCKLEHAAQQAGSQRLQYCGAA